MEAKPIPLRWREEAARKQQRTRRQYILPILIILLLGGGILYLLYRLDPTPNVTLVSLCVHDYQAPFPVPPLTVRDHAALREGRYFVRTEAPGSPLGQSTLVRTLQHLATLDSKEDVVLYVSGLGRVGPDDRVYLLPADADPDEPQTWLSLNQALKMLCECPSNHKLLILDIMHPISDPRLGIVRCEVPAHLEKELKAVEDPNLLVLCSCSPGQMALSSEYLGRTVFGYYLEEGLRGWADGALNGETDSRVTVRELDAFLRRYVDRWARIHQRTRQIPMLVGEGSDFPLVALEGEPPAPLEPQPVGDYPEWLTKVWKKYEADSRSSSSLELRLLDDQMDATLLRAQANWRAGLPEDQVRQRFEAKWATLQQQANVVRQRTLPTPRSLALARTQGQKPDEATTDALRSLLIQVENMPADLPADKQQAEWAKLVKPLLDKQKGKPPFVLAWSVFALAASDPAPAPDIILFLDYLLRQVQPKPLYIETLFLHQLAQWYPLAQARGIAWPTGTVRGALQVVQLGEQADARARSYTLVSKELEQAAQQRHDGEMLFEAIGYAPLKPATQQFQTALASYERLQAEQVTVEQAHQLLDEARSFLPAYLPYLEAEPALNPTWTSAVREALELARELDQQTSMEQKRPDLQRHTRLLNGLLTELRAYLIARRLNRLINESEQGNAAPSLLLQLDGVLALPFISLKDRERLWKARQTLSRQLGDVALTVDYSRRGGLAPYGSSEAEKIQLADATLSLRRLRRWVLLLELGGVPPSKLAEIQNAFPRKAEPGLDLVNLAWLIRKAFKDDLPASRKARLEHDQRSEKAYWNWLVRWYRYEAREHPGKGMQRLIRQFYLQTAQEYSQGRSVADFPHIEFGQISPKAPSKGKPVQQVIEVRPTPAGARPIPVTLQTFEPGVGWLQIKPQSIKLPTADITTTPEQSYLVPFTVALRPEADQVKTEPPPGFLLRGRLASTVAIRPAQSEDRAQGAGEGNGRSQSSMGRAFHYRVPVPLGPPQPTILVTNNPEKPAPALTDIRLRPISAAQSFAIFVTNPPDKERKVVVKLTAGAVAKTSATVTLAPGAMQKISFQPTGSSAFATPAPSGGAAPGAAPAPKLPPLSGPILIQVLEAGKGGKLLAKREVPVRIASPSEYVDVSSARFAPTGGEDGKNRLTVTLQARHALRPPACPVTLAFPVGTVAYEGGTLRGVIPPDGKEISLFAKGVRLLNAESLEGTFYLDVDGFQRAFVFRTTFARQGSAVTPNLQTDPGVRLLASRYGQAGPNYSVGVASSNAPPGARLEVKLGRIVGGAFRAELSTTRPSARRQRIAINPAGPADAVILQASVADWKVTLDTTGIRGDREVRVNLLDRTGRLLASDTRGVVLGDESPGKIRFVDLPEQAWSKAPLVVKARGADPVAGIKEVSFFVGKPADGKVPKGVEPVKARPLDASKTLWGASLPLPESKKGPTDISVRFVNGVGLSTFETAQVVLVEKDPAKTRPARITGRVLEGSRPQPGIKVTLADEKGKPISSATTKPDGTFEFPTVPPGKYKLTASKSTTNRKGEAPRGAGNFLEVKPGSTNTVDIVLYL